MPLTKAMSSTFCWRDRVLECGASAPLSLTRLASPHADAERWHPATCHRQSSRGPGNALDRAERLGVRRSFAAFTHPPGSTSRQFQSVNLAIRLHQSSGGLKHSRMLAREFLS
jgi:hypothetical protein